MRRGELDVRVDGVVVVVLRGELDVATGADASAALGLQDAFVDALADPDEGRV